MLDELIDISKNRDSTIHELTDLFGDSAIVESLFEDEERQLKNDRQELYTKANYKKGRNPINLNRKAYPFNTIIKKDILKELDLSLEDLEITDYIIDQIERCVSRRIIINKSCRLPYLGSFVQSRKRIEVISKLSKDRDAAIKSGNPLSYYSNLTQLRRKYSIDFDNKNINKLGNENAYFKSLLKKYNIKFAIYYYGKCKKLKPLAYD